MKKTYKTIKVGDKVKCWETSETILLKGILEKDGYECHIDGKYVIIDRERKEV